MTEYIDREYVLKCMEDSYKSAGISAEAKAKMTRWLNKAPAADVRPVVLCGECKRYGGRPWEKNETGICARTDSGVREDDFCSYGERREES